MQNGVAALVTAVPHVQNALYFWQKVRVLYCVNALYFFLGSIYISDVYKLS